MNIYVGLYIEAYGMNNNTRSYHVTASNACTVITIEYRHELLSAYSMVITLYLTIGQQSVAQNPKRAISHDGMGPSRYVSLYVHRGYHFSIHELFGTKQWAS